MHILENVKDFGAQGDGITRDDNAINQAIEQSKYGIYFPEGEYIISNPIRLRSNLKIYGTVNTIVKIVDNADESLFSVFVSEGSRKENIEIKNIIVDGNRSNNIQHGLPDANGNQPPYWSGYINALINITNVSNITLLNLKILNSWGSGIWITNCLDVKVSDCIVRDYRISGIAIRSNPDVCEDNDDIISSENIIVSNNSCSGGVVGIHSIFGVKNVRIMNNYCFNNKDQNRFPLGYKGKYPKLYPDKEGFKDVLLDGYKSPAFEGDGAGIELTGKYTQPKANVNEQIIITNNHCENNMVGIRSEEDTRHTIISNNMCVGNLTHGIFIFSSRFISINGNNCNNNGRTGITIEKLDKDIPNLGSTARPEQLIVTSNLIFRNAYYGIKLIGVWQCNISNNSLSGNNTSEQADGSEIGLFAIEESNIETNLIIGNQFVSYDLRGKFGIYCPDESSTRYSNIPTPS